MWLPCWCIYLVYNNNRVCLMNKNFKNVKSTTFLKLKSIDKNTGGFFFTWDIILLRSRGINSKYNVRFHYTLQSFDIFLPSHQISDNHFLASFNLGTSTIWLLRFSNMRIKPIFLANIKSEMLLLGDDTTTAIITYV